MTLPGGLIDTIVVVSRGEAVEERREAIDPQARTTIRYADPAAWITASAAAEALAPVREAVDAVRHEIGVLTLSQDGPAATMAVVGEAAAAGFSSPLRYPAANPGSLAGVLCIAFGLRGPALNLTMPPADAVPLALQAASGWLERQAMPLLLVAACSRVAQGHRARCLLLSLRDDARWAARPLSNTEAAWLAAVDN